MLRIFRSLLFLFRPIKWAIYCIIYDIRTNTERKRIFVELLLLKLLIMRLFELHDKSWNQSKVKCQDRSGD